MANDETDAGLDAERPTQANRGQISGTLEDGDSLCG
jgi:hypothetical protein